ncbi:pentatricopeptide repeat-containing protein At3g21470-like [Impatiens glandulifera]|uniref:pentatricopeptide repeat-containing protein At3g21470-like n=1 Tax=Impatiens glandulifera TaxID=253017 RepID=UPI001FB1481E|nr:pentatricopeptide repeat-containing protein At3g21470-like [Impatiens glandulifera]
MALHAECLKMGILFDVMVGTSLIHMYGKCDDIIAARKVFDYMPKRNVVTWNALLGGYMRNHDTNSASVLFNQMSVKSVITWNEMIDGYARNGDILTARKMFDQVPSEMRSVVTWTVLVEAYVRNGEMESAREVFDKMPVRNCFVWSSMVSGYFKKGDIQAAKAIFMRIPDRNLVNWNSYISGLSQNGHSQEVFDAFEEMLAQGFKPDEITLVSVLSACAQSGQLGFGKRIHNMIIHMGIKLNRYVQNGLIDMYAKCGDLKTASLIFENILSYKNVTAWNAMITGFAVNGYCKEALEYFRRMEASTEELDGITFLSVFLACAHGGFVEEGLEIFWNMEKHRVTADVRHYGCIIDLLGRAGRLEEAYELIIRMPMNPNDTVWGALLGACRIHSNIVMADKVMDEIGRLDSYLNSKSCKDPHYLSLSNIYAAADDWEKAEGMRNIMSIKGLQKVPGYSVHL